MRLDHVGTVKWRKPRWSEGWARLCTSVYIGTDLKMQESHWASRRSGSSHLNAGLTGLLNPT